MPSCNWSASRLRSSFAAEGIAAGDVSAIMPYLRALDRLDRYQTVASANQVYDDEARQKLLAKINRVAENLGIDESFAAAVRAHLKATGQIRGDEPAEAEGQGADLAGAPEFMGEAGAPEFVGEAGSPAAPPAADHPGAGFFYSNWP